MRTHYCGDLRAAHAGSEIELAGWVHRRRDHGGVIFLDLRDREGIVQVTIHPGEQPGAYAVAERVRSEFVVAIKGMVRRRPQGAENPNLPTGDVEVFATSIEVLAESETPPFQIEDGLDAAEEIRIRHRYLDLRRPEMTRMLKLRSQVLKTIRSYFDELGFIEVETPLLTKATPEGARDFLVPSRIQPGTFFALPQSPQLFKQLLMIAGVDRYYQIARCFRDEDPRADRQPDFTQLDIEMSFAGEAEIQSITEGMFVKLFAETLGVELTTPFPRITYADSWSRFGSDKPDLRFGIEITDVSQVFESTSINVFRSALEKGGKAKALRVEGQAMMGKKAIEHLVRVARNLGTGGMAWVAVESESTSGPLSKVMSQEEVAGLRQTTGAGPGDLILIVCDKPRTAEASMGAVRLELAGTLNLRGDHNPTDAQSWKFAWVIDPPLFEWNETEKRWDATHHPFTAPRPEHEPLLESDPGAVLARCYDIVLNGWELGSGSIRIHRPALQKKIFDLIGLDAQTVERRFGWFVNAFKYGAPPHGGIAPGIDRIVALLAGRDNIRDAIAFPKTGTYTDPLTGAPDEISPAQLKELRLRVVPE
jgi:aspartyl-tRNA synthetase